jgi:hypothetical protein|tara:strand:+ start:102 stop:233 length:132 start_codon:yes stop_codon:yes gene_type:complete
LVRVASYDLLEGFVRQLVWVATTTTATAAATTRTAGQADGQGE